MAVTFQNANAQPIANAEVIVATIAGPLDNLDAYVSGGFWSDGVLQFFIWPARTACTLTATSYRSTESTGSRTVIDEACTAYVTSAEYVTRPKIPVVKRSAAGYAS